MNDTMRLLPRAVHFPFCRNRSYLFHKAIIKGSVDRVNAVGVNVKKRGTNYKAIPHNSKCRYGERGAAAAKPKAQIILCVLSSILATQMPCRTPSRSEALRSATAACGGSWRGDPPERCLSRKAGIVRRCRKKRRKATAFRQSLLGYAVCFWLFPQGKVTTR